MNHRNFTDDELERLHLFLVAKAGTVDGLIDHYSSLCELMGFYIEEGGQCKP